MTNPEKTSLVDRLKTIEKRLLVIVNPMSRKGSELASKVRSMMRREGMDMEETSTDHPDDIGSTVQFWSRRFGGSRVIMVFGGDGALNQVINNVMLCRSNKNVVLVPIPAGTANDFCRALGIENAEHALTSMVDLQLQSIDLLKLTIDGDDGRTKYCSNILGLGIDGELAHQSQKYKRFGIAGYWYASLKKVVVAIFRGVETYDMKISFNGYERHGRLVGAMFANIEKYGHDLKIAPGARINDGRIYITLAKPMNALKAFLSGLLLVFGEHSRMSTVETLVTDEVDIEILDDIYAQEDGEVCFYPSGTRINLSLERQALNVLSPSKNVPSSP